MSYIENPKTKGSGIYCAIPQDYKPCSRNCKDCFFQNGRSYLEPLVENLPNIPPKEIIDNFVIRVNDGLDSGQDIDRVIEVTKNWPNKFYNTTNIAALEYLPSPTVLTINPGNFTDERFHFPYQSSYKPMAVRFRANMWNQKLLKLAVEYWTSQDVPVIITFMRYYEKPKEIDSCLDCYDYKDHILNPSWSININGWENIMWDYAGCNSLVFACGAGPDKPLCKDCGVCLQLYWRSKDERKNKNL